MVIYCSGGLVHEHLPFFRDLQGRNEEYRAAIPNEETETE